MVDTPMIKRRRLTNKPKFAINQKVEVRSFEDGFQGSWHSGVVIHCESGNRVVRYDHLLADNEYEFLVEIVEVSLAIDGEIDAPEMKGRNTIRPPPPKRSLNEMNVYYGLCVDWYFNDAWWEGVVFDYEDGANCRKIFFPDLGDVHMAEIGELRITQDWNENTEEWKPRGVWLFMEILEKYKMDNVIPVSVTQIWYDVRVRDEFSHLREWCSSSDPSKWEKLIMHVIDENLNLTIEEFLSTHDFLEEGMTKCKAIKSSADIHFLDVSEWGVVAERPLDSQNDTQCSASAMLSDDQVVPHCGNPNSTELRDKSETKVVLSRQMRNAEKSYLAIRSEYCPESVFEYLKLTTKYHATECRELQDKVRKHLSAIGWSFWIKIKKGKEEWRYDSPTSNKTYYSLKTACGAIVNGKEINTRNSGGKNDVACCEAPVSRRPNGLRQHKDVGIRKSKRKQNGFQISPRSLIFNEGWDGEVRDHLQGAKNVERCKRLVSGFMSKKRKPLGKVRNSSKVHNSSRVLRSSKIVRQTGPSSSSQIPRTVLSWLIDNNVVVPRSKVLYYRDDGRVEKEGRITSDGIKCSCCQKVFPLSKFEVHAGGRSSYPARNIFLEDGNSIASCQFEMMGQKLKGLSKEPIERAMGEQHINWNDNVCLICQYGGELILCDRCPSSFHATCLSLVNIPDGDWFCPSCCCAICGESQCDLNAEHFTDKSILSCYQCERQYHVSCIRDREMVKLDVRPAGNWYCSRMCERVQWHLQSLLGKPILVGGHDNLTWTLVKPMNYQVEDFASKAAEMTENYCKLSVALDVMHECFEPVKEPRTKRDLVEDVLFCRGSNLNRLNFKGFFTVLLERNDELISVATLRVYGNTVAEIPLIGTRYQYRRLGMCRILMNEVEKNLIDLGVKKLVLPAAPSVLSTWTTSFGFSPVSESDRCAFRGFTFLDFQDTILCQKVLCELPSTPQRLPRNKPGDHRQQHQNIEGSSGVLDHEENSCMSEVYQEDKLEGSDIVDQGAHLNVVEEICNGASDSLEAAPVPMETCSSKTTSDPSPSWASPDLKKVVQENCKGTLNFYARKKAKELRSPSPQTSYSKVEVSCR